MDVARKLEKLLNAAGAEVVLTREEDGSGQVRLEERVLVAEQAPADVLVSLHNNWSDDPGPSGVITFYYYGRKESRKLASVVHPHVVESTNMNDGRVRAAGYYVTHHTSMPSILVELGFMSNPEDEVQLLQEQFRQRAARGLFEGLAEYFSRR
jgi:N-acetylmuramoyl-L-alanine amidase